MNAEFMAEAGGSCFEGVPGTFNRQRVADVGTSREAKAMAVWRGICRAEHTGSKAEFAHRLAAKLVGADGSGQCPLGFEVPEDLKQAIKYVVDSVNSTLPQAGPGAV